MRSCLEGLYITPPLDEATVRARFPFLKHAPLDTRIIGRQCNAALRFDGAAHLMHIDNCVLVNRHDAVCRLKYVLHASIVNKSVDMNEYQQHLAAMFNGHETRYGVWTVRETNVDLLERVILAGQFANIYLVPELREPTIGVFLSQHPDFVRKAFGTN